MADATLETKARAMLAALASASTSPRSVKARLQANQQSAGTAFNQPHQVGRMRTPGTKLPAATQQSPTSKGQSDLQSIPFDTRRSDVSWKNTRTASAGTEEVSISHLAPGTDPRPLRGSTSGVFSNPSSPDFSRLPQQQSSFTNDPRSMSFNSERAAAQLGASTIMSSPAGGRALSVDGVDARLTEVQRRRSAAQAHLNYESALPMAHGEYLSEDAVRRREALRALSAADRVRARERAEHASTEQQDKPSRRGSAVSAVSAVHTHSPRSFTRPGSASSNASSIATERLSPIAAIALRAQRDRDGQGQGQPQPVRFPLAPMSQSPVARAQAAAMYGWESTSSSPSKEYGNGQQNEQGQGWQGRTSDPLAAEGTIQPPLPGQSWYHRPPAAGEENHPMSRSEGGRLGRAEGHAPSHAGAGRGMGMRDLSPQQIRLVQIAHAESELSPPTQASPSRRNEGEVAQLAAQLVEVRQQLSALLARENRRAGNSLSPSGTTAVDTEDAVAAASHAIEQAEVLVGMKDEGAGRTLELQQGGVEHGRIFASLHSPVPVFTDAGVGSVRLDEPAPEMSAQGPLYAALFDPTDRHALINVMEGMGEMREGQDALTGAEEERPGLPLKLEVPPALAIAALQVDRQAVMALANQLELELEAVSAERKAQKISAATESGSQEAMRNVPELEPRRATSVPLVSTAPIGLMPHTGESGTSQSMIFASPLPVSPDELFRQLVGALDALDSVEVASGQLEALRANAAEAEAQRQTLALAAEWQQQSEAASLAAQVSALADEVAAAGNVTSASSNAAYQRRMENAYAGYADTQAELLAKLISQVQVVGGIAAAPGPHFETSHSAASAEEYSADFDEDGVVQNGTQGIALAEGRRVHRAQGPSGLQDSSSLSLSLDDEVGPGPEGHSSLMTAYAHDLRRRVEAELAMIETAGKAAKQKLRAELGRLAHAAAGPMPVDSGAVSRAHHYATTRFKAERSRLASRRAAARQGYYEELLRFRRTARSLHKAQQAASSVEQSSRPPLLGDLSSFSSSSLNGSALDDLSSSIESPPGSATGGGLPAMMAAAATSFVEALMKSMMQAGLPMATTTSAPVTAVLPAPAPAPLHVPHVSPPEPSSVRQETPSALSGLVLRVETVAGPLPTGDSVIIVADRRAEAPTMHAPPNGPHAGRSAVFHDHARLLAPGSVFADAGALIDTLADEVLDYLEEEVMEDSRPGSGPASASSSMDSVPRMGPTDAVLAMPSAEALRPKPAVAAAGTARQPVAPQNASGAPPAQLGSPTMSALSPRSPTGTHAGAPISPTSQTRLAGNGTSSAAASAYGRDDVFLSPPAVAATLPGGLDSPGSTSSAGSAGILAALNSPMEDEEDLYVFEPRSAHMAPSLALDISPQWQGDASGSVANSGPPLPSSSRLVVADLSGDRADTPLALPRSVTPRSVPPSPRDAWVEASASFLKDVVQAAALGMEGILLSAVDGSLSPLPLSLLADLEAQYAQSGKEERPSEDARALLMDVWNEDIVRICIQHPHASAHLRQLAANSRNSGHPGAATLTPNASRVLADLGERVKAALQSRILAMAANLDTDFTGQGVSSGFMSHSQGGAADRDVLALLARVDAVVRVDVKAGTTVAGHPIAHADFGFKARSSTLEASTSESESALIASAVVDAIAEELLAEAMQDMAQ